MRDWCLVSLQHLHSNITCLVPSFTRYCQLGNSRAQSLSLKLMVANLFSQKIFPMIKVCIGPDRIVCAPKIAFISLPINLNMCFGCSKEPSP